MLEPKTCTMFAKAKRFNYPKEEGEPSLVCSRSHREGNIVQGEDRRASLPHSPRPQQTPPFKRNHSYGKLPAKRLKTIEDEENKVKINQEHRLTLHQRETRMSNKRKLPERDSGFYGNVSFDTQTQISIYKNDAQYPRPGSSSTDEGMSSGLSYEPMQTCQMDNMYSEAYEDCKKPTKVMRLFKKIFGSFKRTKY